MKNDWESPKEEVRGPTRQPEGCLVAPLGAPFAYLTPLGWKPLNRSCFRVSSPPRCGNLQTRKSISEGQIPPGRSPPGRGDRRHHRHGHHRDHHQHHTQHQQHLHLHPISSHNCNLCSNPYYLSSLLCRCWLLLCGECYWVLLEKYHCVQIGCHLFITSDHDLFYVLWVVTLVLENMGAV